MTIQRYDIKRYDGDYMEDELNGTYVKFTDHQAEINHIVALFITAANEVDSCGESVTNLHKNVSRRLIHLGSELNRVAQQLRRETLAMTRKELAEIDGKQVTHTAVD